MDWAAHLKHFQTVHQKFDADMVILKPFLIHLFYNGLRLFIRAKGKENNYWKDTWK